MTKVFQQFDKSEILDQFRDIPSADLTRKFEQFVENVINNSEDKATALFGTIVLADGREAKVELRIDAEYVYIEDSSNNLDLFASRISEGT